MSVGSDGSGEGGNTTFPSPRRIAPAIRWCFTLNNYTEEEYGSMVLVFKEKCKMCIIGDEKGDSGTPHLQGYVEFKTKCRPLNLFDLNRRS